MKRKIINKILKNWKQEAKATRVIQYEYNEPEGVLYLYTSRPGYLIGKGDILLNKYTDILKNSLPNFKKIHFIKTNYYYWTLERGV